eukprot:9561568-Prorocentrum_lima.AAC.1
MTSSLVGSEMCIRDSRREMSQSRDTQAMVFLPHVGCAATEAATSAGTVSYTHLTLPTICSV